MKDPLISAIDLYKIYSNAGVDTTVIKGISLNIYEGDKLILIGPSGSGKTTLVSLLTGNLPLSAGQVFWRDAGKEISKMDHNLLSVVRREFMGFVEAENFLLPHLSVKENILLTAHLSNKSFTAVEAHFNRLLDILGIEGILSRKPRALSQGEKKRVNIAGALINNPKVVIADEPGEGLDPVNSNEILDLFDSINDELGTAFLMTTHDQAVAERGNRVLELKNGILYGSHESGIKLKNLDKTRGLVLDSLGRLNLPPEILQEMGNPEILYLEYNDGVIELRASESGERIEGDIYECLSCNTLQKSEYCSECGKPTVQV